ncbi:MAG: polysaccharide biosynthesis C-terminal domain-containing protein [Pyrinomonadaceae bacterium]
MTPDRIAIETEISEQIADASNRRSSSWDIRNAPRNYISLVIFQVGSALFSFAAVWLITRHLGSEGYGGIVAVIAASQVAQIFVTWTGVAVVRFGVDEFVETAKIARTFWVRLFVLVINLALVLSLSQFWFAPLSVWLKLTPDSFWLVVAHFVVTAFWLHIQMSLQGAKLPRVQGFLLMVERLVIFIGLLGLLVADKFEFTGIVIVYIFAPGVMILVGSFKLRRYINSRFSIDRAFLWKIFAFSLPLLPFSLAGYFSGSYFDAVFISSLLSTKDLGIYSVSTQINGLALQLPTLANTLLLPLFVTLTRETEGQRTFNYFRDVLPTITLGWGMACTLFAFVGYFGIPLVFGPEFTASTLPLWILLTASTIGIPSAIGYSALSNATSTTYISMIAAILSSIANVAGNFILIPKFGIAGCALATLIAYLVSVLTFGVILNRTAKMPLSWTHFAVLPAVIGTVIASVWNAPFLAFAACAVSSIFICYLFRNSLEASIQFVRKLKI